MRPGRASPSARPWACPDWSASSRGSPAPSTPTCARTHRSARPGRDGSTPSRRRTPPGCARRGWSSAQGPRPSRREDRHEDCRADRNPGARRAGPRHFAGAADPGVPRGRRLRVGAERHRSSGGRRDSAARAGPRRRGRLVFNGFSVGLGLSSGTLKAADQGTAKRDLIEGRLLVAARPLPWLEMSVGPFVRAYVTDAVTERWVFWQARARADAPIVTSGLTSYVELWRAVSSQVNLVAGATRFTCEDTARHS